jgi:hypothetical protein
VDAWSYQTPAVGTRVPVAVLEKVASFFEIPQEKKKVLVPFFLCGSQNFFFTSPTVHYTMTNPVRKSRKYI